MNYRQLAKKAPRCFGCGLENPNGDLICLAHSNNLRHGRGFAHKSVDEMGAFLCDRCHKWYDTGQASRAEQEQKFAQWRADSLEWAICEQGWRLHDPDTN